MDDLISRQAAIDELKRISFSHCFECGEYLSEDTRDIEIISSSKALKVIEALPSAQQWIPVKTRPMDEEERSYWSDRYGFDFADEDAVMFDCQMPEEGQEVWVCTKRGCVFQDICDKENGIIGLEWNGDWDDIVAWMPLNRPEPYKEEE